MIGFLDYRNMKDFYTITELCELFGKTKEELKALCDMLDIFATWNREGNPGFYKNAVRVLHNYLYHEGRANLIERDPWA